MMSSENLCVACKKAITTDVQSLACSKCDDLYHSGKCSGLTKKRLKQLSQDELKAWSCATCSFQQSSSSDEHEGSAHALAVEPLPDRAHSSSDNALLEKLMGKLDLVLSRLDALERKQEKQLEKHSATDTKIENQSKLIQEMEKSIEFVSSSLKDLGVKIEAQKEDIIELQKRTSALEVQLAEKNSRLNQLESDVEKLEIYSRKNNLEIHGIQFRTNENLRETIATLASKLGLPVPGPDAIEAVHRTKGKPNTAPPILVRFSSRETRDNWLEHRLALKGERIYLNENITAKARRLLWLAKAEAEVKRYKFVWIRGGRVLVKKIEGAPIIHIDNENDLRKLV